MAPDTRDGAAQEIPLEIQQMLFEVRERFPLGDVVRELIQVTQPILPVLPVGETRRDHDLY